MSDSYLELISDICSTDKFFIFDEPDRNIKDRFVPEIYTLLNDFSSSFEECWITFHNTSVLALSSAVFYRMKDKYDIEQIELEDAVEILDDF